MSDLQKAIQRMHDQLDSPILNMSREVQQKMDVLQSTQMAAFLEVNRKMQDLISPAIKSILTTQKHLRLSINPQLHELLSQREQISATLKSHYSEVTKLSDHMAKLSKWMPSQDTPLSVYSQVATFSKVLSTTTLAFQQISSYQSYFERLNRLGSTIAPVNIASSGLDIFQRFDYTLIKDEDSEPESQIILLDAGCRIKRIITDIYHNNQGLYTMQPHDFEQMIAELLRFQQFDVEMTKRTRDGGYDLIAVKNVGDFPVRFLVECKRHAKLRKIGVGIVRGFRDVVNTQGANKGIIVTSSYFSPDAEKDRLQNKPICSTSRITMM